MVVKLGIKNHWLLYYVVTLFEWLIILGFRFFINLPAFLTFFYRLKMKKYTKSGLRRQSWVYGKVYYSCARKSRILKIISLKIYYLWVLKLLLWHSVTFKCKFTIVLYEKSLNYKFIKKRSSRVRVCARVARGTRHARARG